jgi:hypothetical protein
MAATCELKEVTKSQPMALTKGWRLECLPVEGLVAAARYGVFG